MKTKKLNLKDLQVQSFITSLEGNDFQTVKGGSSPGCGVGAVAAIGAGAVVLFAVGVVAGAAAVDLGDRIKIATNKN